MRSPGAGAQAPGAGGCWCICVATRPFAGHRDRVLGAQSDAARPTHATTPSPRATPQPDPSVLTTGHGRFEVAFIRKVPLSRADLNHQQVQNPSETGTSALRRHNTPTIMNDQGLGTRRNAQDRESDPRTLGPLLTGPRAKTRATRKTSVVLLIAGGRRFKSCCRYHVRGPFRSWKGPLVCRC